MRIAAFISLLIILAAAIFYIAALATPAWATGKLTYNGNAYSVRFGPFKNCGKLSTGNFAEQCSQITESDLNDNKKYTSKNRSFIRGTRASGVIAVLSSFVAIVLAFFSLIGKKFARGAIACVVSIFSGIAGLIAMAVWAAYVEQNKFIEDFTVGYSFGLVIIAWVFCFINAGVSLVR